MNPQIDSTMLDQDTLRTVTEIIAMGALPQDTTMAPSGWIYLNRNSNYENWKLYEVYVGRLTYTLRAESARHVQQWCAKMFVVGSHYSISLVTRTELLDGEVTYQEKKRFL